jgi:hypothetical protein
MKYQSKRAQFILIITTTMLAFSFLTAYMILPATAAKNATTSATTTSTKVSPTPSPTEDPQSDATTTANLKARIDNVLKNKEDQVKGAIDDLTLRKRGFIGSIERVIEQTVTVKSLTGNEILNITSDVAIMKDSKKAILDDLAVGDWVIALGYTDGQTFTLRRLVASSTTLMPKTYESVIGTAQAVTKTQLTLASTKEGVDPIVYQLNKNTHYEDLSGATLKSTDLKTDSQYLVISYTDQDQKIASFVKSLAAPQTAATSAK